MPTSILLGRRQNLHVDVQTIRWSQPLRWLSSAWRDLREHWWASVAHGVLVVCGGVILLLIGGTHPFFIAAMVSGFMLIAPVASVGLCELSRRRASGETMSFDGSMDGLARHSTALMEFGALLAAFTLVWFVASEILLQRIFHTAVPRLNEVLYGGLLSSTSGAQLLYYLAVGALLALVVFCVSVVAVPLIIDRDATAGEAMRASLRVVGANIPAMLVWSVLLVLLVASGFATLLAGMVVIFPLLGHATWYAYKDLVRQAP